MNNIKDKIAKLLALADSPNEHEAKEALLKARKLMAKHKLSEAECTKSENITVIKELVGISCTAMTNPWLIPLSATIAENYCCKAYNTRHKGGRIYNIGFAGLEDDFEICKRIFLYAYDCVLSFFNTYIHRDPHESASIYREKCNSYGFGFMYGVQKAFEDQQNRHQEWGLVMVVPQAVEDVFRNAKKRANPGKEKKGGYLDDYHRKGYQDGMAFDPGKRIAEGTKPQKL